MLRGNLILSKTQIELLLNNSFLDNALIIQKLRSASQEDIDTTVELSEDELEIILDALPIPSHTEPPVITELRQQLISFLGGLRAEHV